MKLMSVSEILNTAQREGIQLKALPNRNVHWHASNMLPSPKLQSALHLNCNEVWWTLFIKEALEEAESILDDARKV